MIKNAEAPVYIISGAAGNPEEMTPIPDNRPEWSRFYSEKIGYGTLSLLNETAMLWEQLESSTDAVIDYLYIIKDK